jgi:hypothetical protein
MTRPSSFPPDIIVSPSSAPVYGAIGHHSANPIVKSTPRSSLRGRVYHEDARVIPIPMPQVTLTQPTPIGSRFTSSPPAYVTSSPPKYAASPADTETALLFAPPPSFDEAQQCVRCLEADWTCRRCAERDEAPDWVVWLLSVLNVLVWSAVLLGYV